MEWKQLEYHQHADPVETTICLSVQILSLQTSGSCRYHGSRFCFVHECGDTGGNKNKAAIKFMSGTLMGY